MGIYKLSYKELKESLDDWLWSLEGDWDEKDLVRAFNSIAKKEGWKKIKLEETELQKQKSSS